MAKSGRKGNGHIIGWIVKGGAQKRARAVRKRNIKVEVGVTKKRKMWALQGRGVRDRARAARERNKG